MKNSIKNKGLSLAELTNFQAEMEDLYDDIYYCTTRAGNISSRSRAFPLCIETKEETKIFNGIVDKLGIDKKDKEIIKGLQTLSRGDHNLGAYTPEEILFTQLNYNEIKLPDSESRYMVKNIKSSTIKEVIDFCFTTGFFPIFRDYELRETSLPLVQINWKKDYKNPFGINFVYEKCKGHIIGRLPVREVGSCYNKYSNSFIIMAESIENIDVGEDLEDGIQNRIKARVLKDEEENGKTYLIPLDGIVKWKTLKAENTWEKPVKGKILDRKFNTQSPYT